ncbi:hypothetical protein L596_000356 [Steinernema carpocapsae]|uniref:Uncharacterized protein n=1 Tax=Steinernema carpocapsae TaxID=34508 RepID=A0A4U8UM36_STECR|nr:hypothetical protein L596_000356 [Steinernema carpocapsae]
MVMFLELQMNVSCDGVLNNSLIVSRLDFLTPPKSPITASMDGEWPRNSPPIRSQATKSNDDPNDRNLRQYSTCCGGESSANSQETRIRFGFKFRIQQRPKQMFCAGIRPVVTIFEFRGLKKAQNARKGHKTDEQKRQNTLFAKVDVQKPSVKPE